jgi:hypothetical protein
MSIASCLRLTWQLVAGGRQRFKYFSAATISDHGRAVRGAGSYQFVESLERFLLDAQRAKGARPPDPASQTEVIKFPAQGVVFDHHALVVLAAAYNKAIEGQSGSVHEDIAKRIIELASQGERDADKLCQGALALFMRKPRLPT